MTTYRTFKWPHPRHHRASRHPAAWFEFLERYELLSGAPAAPSNLVTQAASTSAITLTWNDNSSDETGFEIQRGTFWWGSFVTIATTGADATSWSNTGLNAGDGYHYRIRAINASGESPWEEGGNSVATTYSSRSLTNYFRSSTMQNNIGWGMWNYIDGVAVWGDGAWMKYSSYDFSAYPTTRFTASVQGVATDASLEIWIDNPTSGTKIGTLNVVPTGNYTDLVPNGTTIAPTTGTHDIYLVYHSPTWNGTNFRTFSFVPNVAPVNSVPGGQLVSRNDSLAFSAANGNLISVTDPDSDNNIVRVTLSASTGKISLATLRDMTLLSGTGTNDTSVTFECSSYYVNDALATVTYTPDANFTGVAWLSVTTDDRGFSGWGGVLTDVDTIAINVTAADPPPATPTATRATATSPSSIRLSWTDASNNETGFEIQRASLDGNYTTIASVGADVTTWDNTGLPSGTTYRYRVRALNASGASNWSATGYDLATTVSSRSLLNRFSATSFQSTSGTFTPYLNPWRQGVVFTNPSDAAWLCFSDFDFNTGPSTLFSFTYETPVDNNVLELRLDGPNGALLGSISVPNSGGYGSLKSLSAAIAGATGVHDLYIIYRNHTDWSLNVESFSFGLNQAPTATVPGAQIILHDTPLSFSGADGNAIGFDDPDNDDHGVKITLAVQHGKLTLASTAGLTFLAGDGANDSTLTFTGTLYSVGLALSGMTYTPDAAFTGQDTLAATVDDMGFNGVNGPLNDTKSVAIMVRNSLVIPNAPSDTAAQATSDSAIHLEWTDNSPDDTGFEIQRTSIGQLSWTTIAITASHTHSYDDTGLAAGAGYVYRVRARNDSGYSAWTGDGRFAATTRFLHDTQRSFLARNYQAQSGGVWNSGWDIAGITSDSWISFGAFDFSQGISGLTAIAAADTAGLAIEVRLDGAAGTLLGQLTLGGTGGIHSLRSFSAALAQATGIHDVYFVFRNANAGTLLNSLSFATNHAPVNTVPGNQITVHATPLVFSALNGNLLQISDDDNPSLPETVTLTVTHGRISLGQIAGLTFLTGDGALDASMTFTGALADINAALARLTYTPDASFHGTALLSVLTDDRGNSGFGGALTDADTVSIVVSNLNNAPVVVVAAHSTGSRVGIEAVPLDVAATDDNGEEALTFTWSCLSSSTGGVVSFTANGTNAARHTLASFSRAGAYTLCVTISDGTYVTTSTVVLTCVMTPAGPTGPTGPTGPITPDPETPAPPAPVLPTGPGGSGGETHNPLPASPEGPKVNPQPSHQFTGSAGSTPSVPSSNAGSGGSGSGGSAALGNTAPTQAPAASPGPAGAASAGPAVVRTPSLNTAPMVEPPAPAPAAAPAPPPKPAEARMSIYELIEQPIVVHTEAPEAVTQEQESAAAVEKQIQAHKTVSKVVGTIASVSGAASVGYLIWIARGGSLLLSMLTSVPMWRFLDPLPVLHTVEPRKKRRWFKLWKNSQQPITQTADETLEHLTD